jgi:Trk K+ transport system NAD-binding subunit
VAALLDVLIAEKAAVVQKMIREIDIPRECAVAAVIRGSEFVVPRGDTRIEAIDRVILVGPTAAIKKAQEVFSIKK